LKSVEVKIVPGGKASRKEVLVRILYAIILGIIGYVLGIVAWVLTVINFFTCLIVGTRIGHGFLSKYIAWMTMVLSYLLFVTDERLPLLPAF